VDERVEANRRMWDERVAIHAASRFYDVEGWKAGRTPHLVAPFEADEIGPVAGRRLCHLQCHFGMDTLSFARLGAEVVGVDFSAAAIEQARALAAEVGLDATFVQSTVEEARDHVEGEFDIVYASWGWHVWLPDLAAWARTVASLLKPGGFLYCTDHHPVVSDPNMPVPYFATEPFRDDSTGTYADVDAPTTNNESYEWQHTIGELVTCVADAGLRIAFLHEHPLLVWQQRGEMVQGDDGMWRLPGDPLPLSFSLQAYR
jgi:SAM-dependent methyltransferase